MFKTCISLNIFEWCHVKSWDLLNAKKQRLICDL